MPHIEIAAEELLSVGGFSVTNTFVAAWLVTGLLIVGAYALSRKIRLVPVGPQNVFEVVIESLLGLMEGIFGSRERAEQYLPIIATLFLFIICSNWFGILPGVGAFGFFESKEGHEVFVPFLRSAASDLNVTLALGIVAMTLVNVSGVGALGLFAHLKKFFTFSNPINFFVGILELLSEFAKIISFSFRLFGNVFAGEVLLVIVGFLAPYGAPVPFLLLEVFVGFIQALVFAMLTMVFISIAVAHHH
ncbi:F0F1 ATP synthase subunit A [Candidatus Kaiserbacteria bacterium]|nr:F0F1 ATP synthase subunit A [Candidatus Kaiserbacteria bacterium]